MLHPFGLRLPAASLLLLTLGPLSSALGEGAVTDPVGFITLNLPGATAANAPAAISFKGLGMTRLVEYQGSAETASGTTLTESNAGWTANKFNPPGASAETATHYVEIVRSSGSQTMAPGEGTTYDIIATSADSLTLAQPLASGVGTGAQFKIRKHWTIESVFGAVPTALQAGTAGAADQVLVYRGSGYDIYYFESPNFLNPTGGWKNASKPEVSNAGGAKILPEDGLIIKRSSQQTTSVTLTGAVKTGVSSIPVHPGVNIIGNVFAAKMTLTSSNLYRGDSQLGLASGTAGEADQVLIYNGSGYEVFYYESPNFLNPQGGWKNAANPDATGDLGLTQIPFGSAVIVKRNRGTGFDWTAPQHPTVIQ